MRIERRLAPRSWAFLVVAALLFAPSALAAPSEAEKTRARALMDQGDELVEKQQLSEALAKYREAHALMGVTTTGIEVARVLERLGRLVEARQAAAEVAAIPAVAAEPQAIADARAAAAALVKRLDDRIPEVVIRLRGAPADAQVSLEIDGKAVATSAATRARKLDPGPHRIEAKLDGTVRTEQIELAEGEHETVTLTFANDAKGPPPAAAPRTNGGSPTLGYVLGGIGIAGLATAAVTGVMIVSSDQKIKDNCPDKRCNAEGNDLVQRSRTLLAINAVAFGVGLVGTGVGGYLVLTSSKHGETALAPRVGPESASLSLLGRF